jgi:hypothetical protein
MNSVETAESPVGTREAELRQWGTRLDKLLAKGDAAGTAPRADYRQRLEELREKYGTAQARLDELKAAGSDKWETFKDGIESAWSELATAFTRVAN